MNTATRWAIRFALFVTAFVVIGIGRPDPVSAQVDVPVDLCGVGIGLLGDTAADCSGPETTPPPPSDTPTVAVGTASATSPSSPGLLGAVLDPVVGAAGLDAVADIDASVPVNVCGVGVGVLGDTAAECGGTAPAATSPSASPTVAIGGTDALVDVDATVPVDLCGVGVGLLGNTAADCGRTQPTVQPAPNGPTPIPVPGDPATEPEPGLVGEVLGDLGVDAGVEADVPVGVCGIGVGLLGDTTSNCASVQSSEATAPVTPEPQEPPTGSPEVPDTPDVPGIIPSVPVLPGLPELPLGDLGLPGLGDLPSTISGLLGSAGGQDLGLQRLLSSLKGAGDGALPGSELAFTGVSTQLLLWLDGALLAGGMLLRSLSKTVSLS